MQAGKSSCFKCTYMLQFSFMSIMLSNCSGIITQLCYPFFQAQILLCFLLHICEILIALDTSMSIALQQEARQSCEEVPRPPVRVACPRRSGGCLASRAQNPRSTAAELP